MKKKKNINCQIDTSRTFLSSCLQVYKTVTAHILCLKLILFNIQDEELQIKC